MGYLETLVLLGLLILIHEAGHLAAAKLVGIPVASFAVGFGPKVWSRPFRGTEYALRMLPLGGYVLPAVQDPEDFRAYPLSRRLVYFLGGPLANLAAALFLAPFARVVDACGQVLASLPGLFAHPETISSVVGIAKEGSRAVAAGRSVELALSLSVSLAVFNLLPIPVLDGGQILMGSLEELFPRLVRLRIPLTLAGLLLLGSVMVYANVHDVFLWLA